MKANGNAAKVRAVRTLLGISIREFAKRCGLNQSTISRIERGELKIGKHSATALEKGTKGLLKKEDLIFGE